MVHDAKGSHEFSLEGHTEVVMAMGMVPVAGGLAPPGFGGAGVAIVTGGIDRHIMFWAP